MSARIPVDYVEGPTGATVWLWPNSPDPITVEFDGDEWSEILERVEASEYDDVETAISVVLAKDLLGADLD